jgi:hypothetical protein
MEEEDTAKYLRLFQICGFFETVGYVTKTNYISLTGVSELFSASINATAVFFRLYIEDLLDVRGADPMLYSNLRWPISEVEKRQAISLGPLGFGGLVTESAGNIGIAFLILPFSVLSRFNSTAKWIELAGVGEAEFARTVMLINVDHGRDVATGADLIHRCESRHNYDIAGLAAQCRRAIESDLARTGTRLNGVSLEPFAVGHVPDVDHFVFDNPGCREQVGIDRDTALIVRVRAGQVQAMKLGSKHDAHGRKLLLTFCTPH